MRWILKSLRNKKGEGYIEVVVLVLVGSFFLVFCLGVFDYLIQKQKLDFFAKELVETASVYGKTEGEVDLRYENLSRQLGISPECDYTGTRYFDYQNKTVQLGEEIYLKLTLNSSSGISSILGFPVTIYATGSALSEQYWK